MVETFIIFKMKYLSNTKDGLVKSLVATGIQDEILRIKVPNFVFERVLGYLNQILN